MPVAAEEKSTSGRTFMPQAVPTPMAAPVAALMCGSASSTACASARNGSSMICPMIVPMMSEENRPSAMPPIASIKYRWNSRLTTA